MSSGPTVLLEDEQGRGFPAVLRYGPYLFLSSANGDQDPATGRLLNGVANDPIVQVRNSYGTVQRRLEASGYGAGCVVRLEHFVSSVDWLLPRLALWKEYFGIELTTGGGSQAAMRGMNMVSTIAIAVTPDTSRSVVAPRPTGPHQGAWAERKRWAQRAYELDSDLEEVRASKAVRAGDLIFTIGARGLVHPLTGEAAPHDGLAGFDAQVDNCFEEFAAYLGNAKLGLDRLVRLDVPLRNIRREPRFRELLAQRVGRDVAVAAHCVGMPVGWVGETDILAIAAANGVEKSAWPAQPGQEVATVIGAGGLLFVSGCSGLPAPPNAGHAEYLDPVWQTRQALMRLEKTLAQCGRGLGDLLRLDLFLRDLEDEDACLAAVLGAVDGRPPTINIAGGRPHDGALVDLNAIAAGEDLEDAT